MVVSSLGQPLSIPHISILFFGRNQRAESGTLIRTNGQIDPQKPNAKEPQLRVLALDLHFRHLVRIEMWGIKRVVPHPGLLQIRTCRTTAYYVVDHIIGY